MKDKNSCFFPRRTLQGFSFFTFFRCFIFHLPRVFPCFTLLRCFHASPFSGVSMFHLSRIFVLLYLECYGFERAFLLPGIFYLTLIPDIWHNLLLSKLPWEPAVLPWRLQGLPLRFETQTRQICLFESHGVQQKVLVGRFCLCVKALPKTT